MKLSVKEEIQYLRDELACFATIELCTPRAHRIKNRLAKLIQVESILEMIDMDENRSYTDHLASNQ